jgi:hypothetical protein
MRMSIRVTLGVLIAMLGALVMFGIAAGPATAAPAPVAQHAAAANPGIHVAADPTPPPTTTAPTDFNKGKQAADAALAKRKLVIGLVCVVLLVIVYFGHRAKYKHILRVRNLQNAKG